jgi:TPR repeat protein
MKWYRLSANQGNTSAQNKLGVMYAKGEGVPEDLVYAFAWWNLAAAQSHKGAAGNKDHRPRTNDSQAGRESANPQSQAVRDD